MRRRFVWICALAVATALPAAAQEEAEEKKPTAPGPWNFGATVGLNLSQSAFSDNWAGGDQGAINWVLNSDIEAERQLSRKFHWDNLLQLSYGQTATQKTDSGGKKRWSRPDKTTDLILLESTGRFTLDAWADPYVAFRLDSQFLDESDPIGELVFNPVKLKESGGIARVFQKTEDRKLVSRIGVGFRQTIARTFTDTTGDATESFTTNDGGFEFQTDAAYPLASGKIQYKGKILVFLPVFYSLSDELEEFDTRSLLGEDVADFWKAPDVNFQNSFDAKITEWLAVNLYLQWVYDKFDAATNVDPALADAALLAEVNSGIRKSGQFKQTLALALSYRFL